MKNLFICLLISSLILVSKQGLAADLEAGQQIFTANCAACHAGGNNVLMPEKTLKTEALEENGMKSIEAITNQVKNDLPSLNILESSIIVYYNNCDFVIL